MCGLFGIFSIGPLSKDEKALFTMLGILSASRGRDATGFCAIDTIPKTGNQKEDKVMYGISKAAKMPYDFFHDQGTQTDMNGRTTCLIGHNRHATVGEKIQEAAHPFEHDFIVGAHNGTIRGYARKEDFSDSDRLYKRISEVGLKEAMKDLPYDSAYALTFWDMEDNSVNLFRNNQRPLTYCISTDGKTAIWASEIRFIRSALAFMEMDKKFGDPGIMKTNTLVRLFPGKEKIRWSIVEDYLEKELIEKHERKYDTDAWRKKGTGTTVTYYNSNGWHWNGNAWTHDTDKQSTHDYWREYEEKRKKAQELRESVKRAADEASKSESETKPPKVRPFRPLKPNETRITYTYWPLNHKVSKRIVSGATGSSLVYEDFKPDSPDYAGELRNCQRYIHTSNSGVWIDLDADQKHLTIHLPSGKTKAMDTDDPRFAGWKNLMYKMNAEWNIAMRQAVTAGTSSYTIRFYPWNDAHSFVAAHLGIYEDDETPWVETTHEEEDTADAKALEDFGEWVKKVDEEAKEEALEAEGKKRKRDRPSKRDRQAQTKEAGEEGAEGGKVFSFASATNDSIPEFPSKPYYVGWKKETLSLDEADARLSANCWNCFERHTVDDKVYWISPKIYVCEPCADMAIVQTTVNIHNATLGKKVA